jgi:hypothetical protein
MNSSTWRVRENGFTPAVRDQLVRRFNGLRNRALSVLQSSGGAHRPVGAVPHSRQNEGLPMAQTRIGRPVRISRVDAGQSSAQQNWAFECWHLTRETSMLRDFLYLILFFVLLVTWAMAWLVFHVAGGLIHLLLIIAVISLILHLFRGSRAA